MSFFGFGGGWGLGFGFGWGGWGGFGWLPIGPCDRFFPWWGGYRGRFGVVGFDRFGTLNRFGGIAPLHAGTRFSNLAHINDAHIGGALSTVGAGKFGAGRVTAVAASRAQLSGAHMMTGNLPVVPTRASLSASGRAAAPSTIHSGGAQHFFGTESTARPESFQQQTAHLQQSMQQSHFSPVAAGARATGPGSSESRGMSATGAGKPSAGTVASGRETNSGSTRSGNQPAANDNGNRGGSTGPSSSANRAESVSPSRGEPNRSEWKTFTPPSHSSESAARSAGGSESYGRGESGSYWNRTAPSSSYSHGSASSSYERGGSSRPQLNMRQPIVQPRSSGGYGGYHGAPSYGGSRSGYSGGGSHSAPSSSGGGHSSGGGASHSSGGGHH